MINPLVSIIVPCYNQAQYLPETLDSVLAQTYPYWECIIVNDGSPDNTEEIAQQYCAKDERFKYVYKENGGVSSTRNTGIKLSKGIFILPLDSDDLIGSEYLERAVEHFIKNPNTKLVYCKADFFGERNETWVLPEYNFDRLIFGNLIFCSAFFRRVDYDKTGGYNENMRNGFEDWDFWLTFLNEKDNVYCITETCFFYRIKKESTSTIIDNNSEMLMSVTKLIYNNHKHLYENFLPNIIWTTSQVEQQRYEIEHLEMELKKIRTSKAYRFGKIILKPFRILNQLKKKK